MNHSTDPIPETRIPMDFERQQIENIEALLEKIYDQLMNADDILDKQILSLFRLYSSYLRLYLQLDKIVLSGQRDSEDRGADDAASLAVLTKNPPAAASESHPRSAESTPRNPDKKDAAVNSLTTPFHTGNQEQNVKKQSSRVNNAAGQTFVRIPTTPAQSGLYAKAVNSGCS